MLEFCGSVIYAWKHFIVTLDPFECWDFTFSAFISIFEVLYLNCNEAQFNVSNAFVVCLFFNYPPKAESCRVVDGVWGCSLLWGSCCREAGSHLLLPSNSASNSTTKMWFCWRERVVTELRSLVFSFRPLLSFLCARENEI